MLIKLRTDKLITWNIFLKEILILIVMSCYQTYIFIMPEQTCGVTPDLHETRDKKILYLQTLFWILPKFNNSVNAGDYLMRFVESTANMALYASYCIL